LRTKTIGKEEGEKKNEGTAIMADRGRTGLYRLERQGWSCKKVITRDAMKLGKPWLDRRVKRLDNKRDQKKEKHCSAIRWLTT